MKQRIWMVMCSILLVVMTGCGSSSQIYLEETETTEDVCILEDTEKSMEETEKFVLYVHVCGAVLNPGVYELPMGSRIYEAIALAGGLREDACEDSINQAEILSDGEMIKVLTVEEAAVQQTTGNTEEAEEDGRVNINTADAEQLMTLPGIGASKAESILSYRNENGSFSSVEELMNITGIKEGVYSKIKNHITVD